MAENTKAKKSEELSDMDVARMIRHWHSVGRPEHANRLKELHRAGEPIPYQLLDKVGVKSEKEVEGKLEVPPRSGRGSGDQAWREFAAEVSDMDKAVLDKMSREEIQEFLEEREIIPPAEEGEEETGEEEEEGEPGDSEDEDSEEDENPDEEDE